MRSASFIRENHGNRSSGSGQELTHPALPAIKTK